MQLQGLLVNHTGGTAKALVRNNKGKLGLESYRLLCSQFNAKTIQATMMAQHREQHPKGAQKLSDMPARLLAWEQDLRRCADEGRDQPSDECKRLALLRMLPSKQRDSIWETADKLYPSFQELLTKIKQMIQDDVDKAQAPMPMDIDHIEPEEE